MGAVSIIFVMNVTPGHPAYQLKRALQDVRSRVDPSSDNAVLEELKEHRNDVLSESSADEEKSTKLESIDKEISNVQQRIDQRSDDDAPSIQQSGTVSEDSTDQSSESDDAADDHGSSQPTNTSHTTRDACRKDLDDRKRAGEQIASDLYKACDSL
jgi:hypothetical protein